MLVLSPRPTAAANGGICATCFLQQSECRINCVGDSWHVCYAGWRAAPRAQGAAKMFADAQKDSTNNNKFPSLPLSPL